MTDVLLFVPGLLGSELFHGDDKVWPGSLFEGVVGFSDATFKLLLQPDLRVGGIVEWAAGVVDIYAKWMQTFAELSRNGAQLFSADARPATLYTAPYDWRLDLRRSAKERLAPVIRKIHQDHGGHADIHIVAHSLGGLLTRYYLQSGLFNNEPGFGAIKSFITFGTPHNGAPVALAAALGLHATNFMSMDQSVTLANDVRYPSLYQTFPVPDAPIIWEDGHKRLHSRGLNDRAFAVNELKLKDASLKAAAEFRAEIDLAHRPIPANIRTFLVAGTRYSTITHIIWDGHRARNAECPDAGDGTVSIQGAYLPGQQIQFTGESHVDLIESEPARNVLQQFFDAEGLTDRVFLFGAFAAPVSISIEVRDLQISTGAPAHLHLKAPGGVSDFNGNLSWERASPRKGATPEFVPVATPAPSPIHYSGPKTELVTVMIDSPSEPGVYRVVLKGANVPDSAGPAFVVANVGTGKRP